MDSEPDAWIPARSAGWGADRESSSAARAQFEGDSGYPKVSGRVAYLDVPQGSVGVAALVKVAGAGAPRWELQSVGISDVELLGALRVQLAKLERRLADED